MRFADLLPAFDNECAQIAGDMLKLAYATAPVKKPTPAQKVDAHHKAGAKDWGSFEKNMRAKKFRQAVYAHPESDEKLKKYVLANGQYKDSKDVAGVVPSRSSSKMYQVKRLPGGRLGCGCKDWQYKHSHQGTDCEHIKELRQGMEKSSSILAGLSRGVALSSLISKSKESREKGKTMKENVVRLHLGQPLVPVRH